MAILKKQTAGTVLNAVTLILAAAGLIAYFINVGSTGYFENAAVPTALTMMLLSVLALAAVVVLAQLKLNKTADMILDLVSGALRIAAPAGLIAAAMMLVESRAQGLAYIYFSNEEVLAEVQTAANLSSASCAIASILLLVAAAVLGIVAAFFKVKKEN